MARDTPDKILYPLAWEESYRKGASGWRSDGARGSMPVGRAGGRRALELGAGCGAAAAELARSVWPDGIACVDVSATALRSFPKRLAADPRILRLVADARKLPFRDLSFDFVMARHILTHALGRDDERILAEAARVLSPGGRLCVEVFSTGDARESKGTDIGEGAKLREGGLVWRFYDAAELEKALCRSGFVGVKVAAVRREATYRGTAIARESLVATAEKQTA